MVWLLAEVNKKWVYWKMCLRENSCLEKLHLPVKGKKVVISKTVSEKRIALRHCSFWCITRKNKTYSFLHSLQDSYGRLVLFCSCSSYELSTNKCFLYFLTITWRVIYQYFLVFLPSDKEAERCHKEVYICHAWCSQWKSRHWYMWHRREANDWVHSCWKMEERNLRGEYFDSPYDK